MNKFHDYLRSRIAGSEPVDDHRGTKLDEKRTRKNCTDCREETKVHTQEITEIKNRMDKLFEMVENITNNDGEIRERSNKIEKK